VSLFVITRLLYHKRRPAVNSESGIENWQWQHFHILSTVALAKVDGNIPHRPQINTNLRKSDL
jgi:hypothetical protein